MKVLSTPKPWSRKARCIRCRTRVELSFKDLKFVADFRDGDYYEWTCPTVSCKHVNGLAAHFVPDGAR